MSRSRSLPAKAPTRPLKPVERSKHGLSSADEVGALDGLCEADDTASPNSYEDDSTRRSIEVAAGEYLRPDSRPLDVHRHSDHPELKAVLSRLADEVEICLRRSKDGASGISVSANGVPSPHSSPSPSPLATEIDSSEVMVRKRGRPKGSLTVKEMGKVREHARRILLDVVLEQRGLNREIGYSRRSQRFQTVTSRYNRIFFSKRPLVRAVDALIALGYVHHRKGGRDKASKKLFSPTMIGTERLLQATTEIPATHLKLSRDLGEELIILRNADDIELEYRDTTETRRMRRTLEGINDGLRTADIRLRLPDSVIRETDGFEGFDAQAKTLVRIFKLAQGETKKSFERGGRFYRGWWQNIPSDLRAHVEIDGKPCAEVDYSGLHFSLMYSSLGRTCPADPYELPGVDKVHRPLVKVVANILINADSPAGTGSGIWNHCVDTCLASPKVRALQSKKQRLATAVSLARPLNTLAQSFKQPILKLHEPIQQFIASGEGARLQFTDSQIAELVMLRMPVPVLPVHDSFLVDHDYFGLLMTEMERAYVDVVGEAAQINCSMKFDRAAATQPMTDMSDWTTYLL